MTSLFIFFDDTKMQVFLLSVNTTFMVIFYLCYIVNNHNMPRYCKETIKPITWELKYLNTIFTKITDIFAVGKNKRLWKRKYALD
jgi:hypothetical protein